MMNNAETKQRQANVLVSECWDILEEIHSPFPLGVASALINGYWKACWMLYRNPEGDNAIDDMRKCLVSIRDKKYKDPLQNITCVVTLAVNMYRSSVTEDWGGWLE